MVTIVFTAGANALDMSKTEREQLKERLILQLRMLAKGTKHEARDRRENRLITKNSKKSRFLIAHLCDHEQYFGFYSQTDRAG